jgi:hypothetical protein
MSLEAGGCKNIFQMSFIISLFPSLPSNAESQRRRGAKKNIQCLVTFRVIGGSYFLHPARTIHELTLTYTNTIVFEQMCNGFFAPLRPCVSALKLLMENEKC